MQCPFFLIVISELMPQPVICLGSRFVGNPTPPLPVLFRRGQKTPRLSRKSISMTSGQK